MRSYLNYLLILLPLTVSLALPCAAKRQIKQNLNTENFHLATTKGENVKFCVSTFMKNEQIQQNIKRLITDSFSLASTLFAFPSFYETEEVVDIVEESDDTINIPLFLLYRKMLIYF